MIYKEFIWQQIIINARKAKSLSCGECPHLPLPCLSMMHTLAGFRFFKGQPPVAYLQLRLLLKLIA